MNDNIRLITYDDDKASEHSESESFFSLQNVGVFWCNAGTSQCDDALEKLVYLITKKPKCLVSHLRRIYYCFQQNLNRQLFAAIVDFLVVLNQRGQAISWRVVLGAKSRLTPEQFTELKSYLKGNTDKNLLSGNQYSVFSKGFVGANKMIQQIEKEEQEQEDDPLIIALDYIEYSQLDEAKQVLEDAILVQPERLDLRQELIDLYRLTDDSNRFHQTIAKLTRLGISITDDWNQLNNYFKGQNKNG